MRIARVVVLSLLAGSFAPLAARAQEQPAQPEDWVWQHDRGARDTTWTFVQMPPGWHITTGPGSVLYRPDSRAAGHYSLSSEIFLFKKPTEEGYGLFFGGQAMGTDSAAYVAVLLRRDGAVSVQSFRAGSATMIAPWTTHAAIEPNDGDQIVENHLRIRVAADSLRVFVNDSSVLAVPRGSLQTDGHFGFRVGRALNLHVTTLDVTRHLAPVAPPAAR